MRSDLHEPDYFKQRSCNVLFRFVGSIQMAHSRGNIEKREGKKIIFCDI